MFWWLRQALNRRIGRWLQKDMASERTSARLERENVREDSSADRDNRFDHHPAKCHPLELERSIDVEQTI
jgi:hypothetical protein